MGGNRDTMSICEEMSKEDRKRLKEALHEVVHKPVEDREDIAFALEDGKLGKRYTARGRVPKGQGIAYVPKELTPSLRPTHKDALHMMLYDRPILCKATRIGLTDDASCLTPKGIFDVLKSDYKKLRASKEEFVELGIRGHTEQEEDEGIALIDGVSYGIELRRRADNFVSSVKAMLDNTIETCSLPIERI